LEAELFAVLRKVAIFAVREQDGICFWDHAAQRLVSYKAGEMLDKEILCAQQLSALVENLRGRKLLHSINGQGCYAPPLAKNHARPSRVPGLHRLKTERETKGIAVSKMIAKTEDYRQVALTRRFATPMGITKFLRALPIFMASVILSAGLLGAQEAGQAPAVNGWSQNDVLRIEKEVRKQIVSLPQYGVFDDIHFGIKGKTIILDGQASRPTLQSSAENVVKKIEGVYAVDNRIEVLPLSPNDDRIRAAVYARIYSYPALQKYSSNRGGGQWLSLTRRTMGITNDPPIGYHAIHIIVKNGNVTLKGVVDNSSDLAVAGMQANLTPGVFSVDNDLFIANEEK
jgi:hyperosmotically inducible protein